MDIVPLKYCKLTQQEITNIVVSVGNRADRKRSGTTWRLVWGSPPRYKFMNRPLDSTIMKSDDPQAIASHISAQTALFRQDIEKRILKIDGEIQPNITLNISLQISRGPRNEICTNFNYPLSPQSNVSRP